MLSRKWLARQGGTWRWFVSLVLVCLAGKPALGQDYDRPGFITSPDEIKLWEKAREVAQKPDPTRTPLEKALALWQLGELVGEHANELKKGTDAVRAAYQSDAFLKQMRKNLDSLEASRFYRDNPAVQKASEFLETKRAALTKQNAAITKQAPAEELRLIVLEGELKALRSDLAASSGRIEDQRQQIQTQQQTITSLAHRAEVQGQTITQLTRLLQAQTAAIRDLRKDVADIRRSGSGSGGSTTPTAVCEPPTIIYYYYPSSHYYYPR